MKTKKPKKKNYNVRVLAFGTILVIGAESKEKALEYARNDISAGDLSVEEVEIDCEVPNEMVPSARRMADAVSEDAP